MLATTAFFRLGEGISASQPGAKAQGRECLDLHKASWGQWRLFKILMLINILFNFIVFILLYFLI